MGNSVSLPKARIRYQYWLSRVRRNGNELKHAPAEIQSNKDIVMVAVQQNGDALEYASPELRNDKQVVMAAINNSAGWALQYASSDLQNDKQVVTAALQKNGLFLGCSSPLEFASPQLQNNKQIVLEAVKQDPFAIIFASPQLRFQDNEITAMLIRSLPSIPPEHQKYYNKLLLEAINGEGEAIKNASSSSSSPQVRKDKGILAQLIRLYDDTTLTLLDDISPELRNDKHVLLPYIQKYPDRIKNIPDELKRDPDILSAAKDALLPDIRKHPDRIKNIPDELKRDPVILTASKDALLPDIRKHPDHIKYIPDELKRDPDILIAAGMLDDNHVDFNERQQQLQIQQQQNDENKNVLKKIVLSTRFSLNATCRSDATNFTSLLKQNEYIESGNFKIYAPNAFDKKTCDPNWTDYNHPCRGTMDTCLYDNVVTKEGHPTDHCCWRYSFRSQLLEAKESDGFMIQVIERDHGSNDPPKLGMGQRIEWDMAQEIKVKTFHMYRQLSKDGGQYKFTDRHIEQLVASIGSWYNNDCEDMVLRIVRPTFI